MTGAREIVAAARPPATIIAEHYAALNGLVAVRSSACAEDSEAASYAGVERVARGVDAPDRAAGERGEGDEDENERRTTHGGTDGSRPSCVGCW